MWMKRVVPLTILASTLLNGVFAAPAAKDIHDIPSFNGMTKYIFGYGSLAGSKSAAIATCDAVYGGTLANIADTDIAQHLANHITEYAYINSWEGKDFEGGCMALFPEGSIAGMLSCYRYCVLLISMYISSTYWMWSCRFHL
jgi:hypothetical protein